MLISPLSISHYQLISTDVVLNVHVIKLKILILLKELFSTLEMEYPHAFFAYKVMMTKVFEKLPLQAV